MLQNQCIFIIHQIYRGLQFENVIQNMVKSLLQLVFNRRQSTCNVNSNFILNSAKIIGHWPQDYRLVKSPGFIKKSRISLKKVNKPVDPLPWLPCFLYPDT
eukprot:NODE_610_length_6054_cov_0.409908.p6 type:complete len:101 gc:universal NODE_610_length_6054_cov_0.409908:4506-4808(+)